MIHNLFSKRQKRARGEMPDVYVYDNIPNSLRVQIIHILKECLPLIITNEYSMYDYVSNVLRKEYGLFHLHKNCGDNYSETISFFIDESNVERVLDVIEVFFSVIQKNIDASSQNDLKINKVIEAIDELNSRFKEHGVGYQFESGEIIRIDSEIIHAEAVKPTLALLRNENFHGANDEFLSAHEHYRHKRYKECLVDACKALESTLKTVCELRGWAFTIKDGASRLIGICFENNLLPAYLESQFSALRSLLESGVPTIRNKEAGHGQGAEPVEVPEYFARYALNMTATSILFIMEAHIARK